MGWFNAGESFWGYIKKIPALFFLVMMMFLKFGQLFYYTVLKKETAISFRHFLKVFDGLWRKGRVTTQLKKQAPRFAYFPEAES